MKEPEKNWWLEKRFKMFFKNKLRTKVLYQKLVFKLFFTPTRQAVILPGMITGGYV
jgi:hypothetical protein